MNSVEDHLNVKCSVCFCCCCGDVSSSSSGDENESAGAEISSISEEFVCGGTPETSE